MFKIKKIKYINKIILVLVICFNLCSCFNTNNDIDNTSADEFLTEVFNSDNYGKDFYSNTPVMSYGANDVMIFNIHDGTFIPYDQDNVIVVAAEPLETPDKVATGGYVGDCSYRHKKICMYNIADKELYTLVDIESGYAGGLTLHDNNILEYHIGDTMTLDTLCLYDIENKKQHTVCTYENYEMDIINTISDKVYSSGDFYYLRFEDLDNSSVYCYNLNAEASEKISTAGLPCIYSGNSCIKTNYGENIQLIDTDTKKCIAEITSDNKLYPVYSSNSNEYFGKIVLNNVTKEIYRFDNGELTNLTIQNADTDNYYLYFYTALGIYVYIASHSGESKVDWQYIPY